jgi:Uma2 family endonuclease
MRERAERRMNLAEFLEWEDGTDTRYELVDGRPVARHPDLARGRIACCLAAAVEPALRWGQIAGLSEALAIPSRNDCCFLADLVVSEAPIRSTDRLTPNPVLIAEIQTPVTELFAWRHKVPHYRRIETVQEVLLIDSRSMFAEVHRRAGEYWVHEIARGPDSAISLASVGLTLRLADLYRGLDLSPGSRRAATAEILPSDLDDIVPG